MKSVHGTRILFFSELLYPHGSGGALATYLYAKLLSEVGFNVVVLTNRFAGEESTSTNGNLTIHRLHILASEQGQKYRMLERVDLLLSSSVRKLVVAADLVYVPEFWYSAIALAKSIGRPVITHLHGYDPVCSLGTLFDVSRNMICTEARCTAPCVLAHERHKHTGTANTFLSVALNTTVWPLLVRKLIGMSDALICVSEAHRRLLIERAPELREKSSVICNPLPQIPILPLRGSDFMYMGGDNVHKGFPVLIKALRFLGSRSVKVHATNLGKMPRSVVDEVRALGVVPYARLDESDLEEKVFKRSRATIFPGIWADPRSYVVTETILRGRLLIASPLGGVPEQTAGCPGVYLFPPGDSQRLSELMIATQNLSAEQVHEMAVRSRQTLLKNFPNERCVSEFSELIYKLIS